MINSLKNIGTESSQDFATALTEEQIYVLEKIRAVQIEIIQEIERICNLANLNYFLMFGTLLGAIRHQGFIPWDDDVDLGMMRHDYELFIKAFEDHASDLYEIQSLETDDYYAFFFLKVIRKNTVLLEAGYQDDRKMNGIFVDIFPFDNAPSNRYVRLLQNKTAIFFKSLLFYQVGRMDTNQGSFFVRSVKKGKNLLAKLMSRKQIINTANRVMQSSKKEGKWLSNFGDVEFYPRDLIANFEPIKFETYEFQAPVHPESLLNYVYGDFMKLPPLAQRKPPHDIFGVSIDGEQVL